MQRRADEPAADGVAGEASRGATWETRPPDDDWWPAALAPLVAWSGDAPPDDHERRALVEARGWKAIGASRRGRLHAHRGAHREDALELCRVGERLLLVVSDGAGSSRWSRVGATYACRRMRELVAERLTCEGHQAGALLGDSVRIVCEELRALAREAGAEARDLRCTLVAAVLTPGGVSASGAGRDGTLESVQVGDGVLAVRRADGAVERVGARDDGAFSGDVTCFVPDPEAPERAAHVARRALDDVNAVLVATDGVEDPFYPIERHGPLLLAQLERGVQEAAPGFQRQAPGDPVLAAPDAASRLLDWLAFEKRGENDDRTLLVAWRASDSPA